MILEKSFQIQECLQMQSVEDNLHCLDVSTLGSSSASWSAMKGSLSLIGVGSPTVALPVTWLSLLGRTKGSTMDPKSDQHPGSSLVSFAGSQGLPLLFWKCNVRRSNPYLGRTSFCSTSTCWWRPSGQNVQAMQNCLWQSAFLNAPESKKISPRSSTYIVLSHNDIIHQRARHVSKTITTQAHPSHTSVYLKDAASSELLKVAYSCD